jgi:hypothetical protein
MLTIWGHRHRFCDTLTRRNFLALGAIGSGLSLVELSQARAAGANSPPARTRSAIMVYLPGGPSPSLSTTAASRNCSEQSIRRRPQRHDGCPVADRQGRGAHDESSGRTGTQMSCIAPSPQQPCNETALPNATRRRSLATSPGANPTIQAAGHRRSENPSRAPASLRAE